MATELWEEIYESLTCHTSENTRISWVEDAFAEGAFCMLTYQKMRDAYDRLCERLGVVDEDADIECIIQCYMQIQQELCKKMFYYGQLFR